MPKLTVRQLTTQDKLVALTSDGNHADPHKNHAVRAAH